MPNHSRIVQVGHLTRDVEMSYTPTQTAVAKFGLATNYKYGEKEEVCFVDVTCFGKTAENAKQYLAKGRAVLVDGRLKLESWTDREGNKRSKHCIIADRVVFWGEPAQWATTELSPAEVGPPAGVADPTDDDFSF